MKRICASLVILLVILFASCVEEKIQLIIYSEEDYTELSKNLDLPEDYHDFTVQVPAHLFDGQPLQRINSGRNHLATLGRVLFYDTRLSSTNTISCASCHKQEFAFADNIAFSDGVGDMITERNSLSLAAAPNLSASYESQVSTAAFGWDHQNRNSRVQSKAAILNQREMGNSNINEVLQKLQNLREYQILTRKAFGHEHIGEFEMFEALDAFMNSISAFGSKFDEGLKAVVNANPTIDFPNFTEQENKGKQIFINRCASCHGKKHDIQTVQTANNGLDLNYKDGGVGKIFGPDFEGLFKVPFLRNIELTAPYMHDGRFESLEEVVEHYSTGIKDHKNLSQELKLGNQPFKLDFTQQEKDALVSFLKTLTDESILVSEKHSNPFK